MPPSGRALRASRLAVTAAYVSQGLGYAVVVTSLPALKARQEVDDTMVSLIVLGVSLAAATGSIVANAVAVRWGSRAALALGLIVQAVFLPVIALPTPLPVFFGAFLLFGIGLGCVDASAAMQGVAVQRAYGRHLLGGFFAAATAAAIVGALLVSFVALSAIGAGIALTAAGGVALVAALVVVRLAAREVPVDEALPVAERTRLPRAGIWVFGFVILAVFISDSAVSTWSTVYLQDELLTLAWVAPLGYAAYQGVVLVTRLVTDRLVMRFGRRRLVTVAAIVSALGCIVVAVLPFPVAAIVGFALAGVASGILDPRDVQRGGRTRARAQRPGDRPRQHLQLRRLDLRSRRAGPARRRPRTRHRLPDPRRRARVDPVLRAALPECAGGGRRSSLIWLRERYPQQAPRTGRG